MNSVSNHHYFIIRLDHFRLKNKLTCEGLISKPIYGCGNKELLFGSWKVDPVVECQITDPKVVGSNPGGTKIGLHVFHKPHIGHKYWFIQEANIKSGLV